MSAAHGLQLERPASALAEHVECYWAASSAGRDGAHELVLPNAAMSMLFSIDDGGRVASVLTGPHSQPIFLDTSSGFTAIGVKFKVGGATPFLETASAELHNQTVRLEDLWRESAHDVEEKIWEARTADEKFHIIEMLLLRRLARSSSRRHPGVAYALQEIDRRCGGCTVAALANHTGLSARRLGQLFARDVGFSPKLVARMRRFTEALRLIDSSVRVEWTEIALSCGYYDQPHFNHEFRTFCRMEPSAYLQQRLSQTHVRL